MDCFFLILITINTKWENLMSTKFAPKKTTIGYSVAAIMAGVVANPAHAIVDIDSVAQYDNAITNAKYQEIANRQANDEKAKMRLYDVLHYLGNSSNLDATSKQYIRDNLPSADVLANGSTFQLYNGTSSAVGSTVATERTVRIGAGSKINTVGGQLDVDNVANITLGGKTYNFAGDTTEGVVSVGDKDTNSQRTITNAAAGRINANSTDVINGSQLHATNEALEANINQTNANKTEIAKGINFTDDNGNTANIKQGGTLGLSKADTNVTVDVDAATNKAKIGLADDINVKTVTANSVTTGTASMSTTGINAGNMKVTNVDDGDVNATSKDAVNGSQLHATNLKVDQNATNIAKGINFGDGNGNTTKIDLGGQFNIEAGSTNVTTKVTNGKVTVDVARDQNLNSTTYGGVKISTTGLNNGGNKVTNVGDGDVNATSKDAINGSQLHNAIQNINTRIGNVVTYDGNTQDQVTLKGPNGTKITNLKAGDVSATSTDAVNGSQLHATNTKVDQNTTNIANNAAEIAKGINFTDDNGNTANIKQGGTLGLSKADNNVTVDVDSATNKAKIGLADDINVKTVTADSVTTGAASMSTTGINAGNMKVTNVADGDINATSKDAINGSQLHATNTTVAKGINFGDGNGNVTNVQLGSQFNVEAGSTNVTTKVTNGKVTVDVARDQNLDSTTYGGVKISTTGLDSGNNKIVNVADGDVNATSKDAVNGSQLHAVKQLIQNSGATNFNVAADTGSPTHIATNDTLNINGGNNIQTTITPTGAVQVGLKDDINVKSITVNGGGSITQNGINAGGNRITNVAEGIDGTDAVNVNQLNRISHNINKIASDAASGTAAAMAVGTLGQAWEPGSSTVSVAGSVYDGKAGWAIGGSNMTDNGRWLIKYNVSGSGNNKFGAAASVTYQY